MDWQRLPFGTVQDVYNRIALLEWFIKWGEADDAEVAEWARLKGLV